MPEYEVYRPTDGGRFPGRVPDVQLMTEWDPTKVRIIEMYDITWDRMIRRFDYLGPDNKHHHVAQTIKGDDRTLDEMIDILHDSWSKNYA